MELLLGPEMNPDAGAFKNGDCPIIDPTDSRTWCYDGPISYAVPCKMFQFFSRTLKRANINLHRGDALSNNIATADSLRSSLADAASA